MSGSSRGQFWALMTKNWIVKKRALVSTAFEILLPAIVLFVLVLIHQFSDRFEYDTNLHLGNDTLAWDLANTTGLLLYRLNSTRSAIALCPSSDFPELEQFITTVVEPQIDRTLFSNLPDSLVLPFATQNDLDAYLEHVDYGRVDEKPMINTVMSGVELYTGKPLPPIPHFEYDVRMNASGSVSTPTYQTIPDPREPAIDVLQPGFEFEQWTKYAFYGFHFLQQLQDIFILNRTGVVILPPFPAAALSLDKVVQYSLIPFPTPAYTQDIFFRTVGDSIGLFFTITFIWSVTRIVASLIEEKELKLREGMKIMGLESKWLILSWIATYLAIFTLSCFSVTAFVCPFLFGHSNYIILFVFFFSFCLSTFSFGYLMSTLFNKSNVGSAFSAIIFLVIYFINEVVKTPGTARFAKMITSLSPAVALSQGAKTFAQFEEAQSGVGFGSLFQQYDGYSVGDAIVMLLFDTTWLFILGLYLEQVLPGEYGITKKWYFPCVACFSKSKSQESAQALLDASMYDSLPDNEEYTKVEPASSQDIGNEGIKIRHLRRTFQQDKNQIFTAVNDLSLDIYLNQCFVLLGHNGAGKSTIINMLTGLIEMTSGQVNVLGKELSNQLPEIRKNLGYCPQHDLLYPTLSVREHLELYADIKGATKDKEIREQMILDIIDEVGLARDNKENALSMTLSGGQKRKLSVAIALLNNSRVVLLDEPSSGMDVAAQRDLWKLIGESKKNRVILLTTHSMEEAEIGDRIAILSHANLQCVGTSHFLKNAYGVGYTLTVSKHPPAKSAHDTAHLKLHPDCTTRSGTAIANHLLPKYPFLSISSDAGMEMGFKVRFEESHQFPALFDDLDSNKERLSIVSYGMSVTTLTEVFLTVGHGHEKIEGVHDREKLSEDTQDDDEDDEDTNSSTASIDYSTSAIGQDMLNMLDANQSSLNTTTQRRGKKGKQGIMQSGNDVLPEKEKYSLEDIYGGANLDRAQMIQTGSVLFWTHFKAMFKKRIANSKRDIKAWVWQLLFPGILLIVSLLMVKLTNVDEYPARTLSPSLWLDKYGDNYKGDTPYVLAAGSNGDALLNHLPYAHLIPVNESDLPTASFLTSEQFYSKCFLNAPLGFHTNPSPKDFATPTTDVMGQFRLLNQLFINTYTHAMSPGASTTQPQFTHDEELNVSIENDAHEVEISPFQAFEQLVFSYQQYLISLASPEDEPSFHDLVNSLVGVPDPTSVVSREHFQKWLLKGNKDGSYRYLAYTVNLYNPEPTMLAPTVFHGTLHFNTTARDALPIIVNALSNALLRAHYAKKLSIDMNSLQNVGESEDEKYKKGPTITVRSNPLPRTKAEKLFVSATVGIFIALSMAFVPSTFVGFLVKERSEKAKHLQIISGVSPYAYWISTYAWDTLNFTLPFILAMIILFAYDMQALIALDSIGYTIAAFWLFLLSVAPFVYCFSFLFESHNTAQNLTLLLGFFLSVILLIASMIMSKLPQTQSYDRFLRYIYRFFPPFAFGETLITITFMGSSWNPDPIWKPMGAMVLDAVLYFTLLLLLESWSTDHKFQAWGRQIKTWFARKLPCCRPKTVSRGGVIVQVDSSSDSVGLMDEEDCPIDDIQGEDDDVVQERNRILYGECSNSQYGIVLQGLRKVYASRAGQPPHVAVNNLYFGIPYGQCFGYLGTNGAGKSTTMKMITGDETPSPNSGSALLGGFDLNTQSDKVRQILGYCPQFDALLPLLTGREHLELYARIKCVPERYISGLVNYMVDKLGLNHLQNNPAGTYSGGNKRKLSIGIALIGQPLVLLLDEPSSGVDPASRREIWRLISSTLKGRAIILTTHSMEECEALCQRIGVITSGNLRAINSAQQLKAKYGDGYQIITKSKDFAQDDLLSFFNTTFTGMQVVEQHGVNFTLKIPKRQNSKEVSFKDIFKTIESNKTSAGIESYSVSDTDLEHIFIGFVEEDNRRKLELRERGRSGNSSGNISPVQTDLTYLGSTGYDTV